MTNTTGADGATTGVPLTAMRVPDLQALASQLGIRGAARLRKRELIAAIEEAQGGADASAPTEDAEVQPAPEASAEQASLVAEAPADEAAADEATAEAPAAEPATDAAVTTETDAAATTDPIADAVFADHAGNENGGSKRRRRDERTGKGKGAAKNAEPEAPLSLDDLVLPPARGEGEDESSQEDGRRRRRVTTESGSPEVERDDENDENEGRPGGRKRSRGRGRRGRGDSAEGTNEQEQDDSSDDDENVGEDESQNEGQGGRRSRSRSRGRGGDNQNGNTAHDDDDERGRGRGRYRDRKRGRGASDDVDPDYSPDDVLLPVAGILDVLDNYAFVRTSGYLPGPNDVYVSLGQVKKYGLRKGDAIVGAIRQPREGEQQHGRQKFNALVKFDSINGQSTDEATARPSFDDLTPLYPEERLRLETAEGRLTQRAIDLFAPIGKGTRGLIVAPPKSGKSVVLQQIANAIAENSPQTHLMVVLVDERPEEITAMRRSIRGEVVASAFDLPSEDHTTIAELAIERAKRLVELGHDVVVLLDSITELARAYNLTAPASGRILSGGVDASALYPPKRFFGAARNVENGGSLTILATAMVETGSRTDEVILEEFAGTGNMEIRLSREIADKRIFPALDIRNSGTLKEEMLLSPAEVDATWRIRRDLTAGETQGSLESVLTRLAETPTNAEFLASVSRQPIESAAPRARR
ncbi:transcription termination factor Rho [Pseudoclavibacter chungangensis]|uniref:Transcription termination factor Rho n=1 Tax=Pseudoclavibacter chungangensis TaxID=587635 RepID=A0A7J5BSU8_9MICO|nr:transcription termination factor Rho [Pseudoclavibacter chungangensis]KAB1657326.1 transcription termination factor Rho [Pseudoclavibacter chungangensis]NYJ66220.1 transcription termination factor Rho [Pseudoclavibacter chungangensis]